MDQRPHSNSTYKSMVTNAERHRRRSQLIVCARSNKAYAIQARFIRQLWVVLLVACILAALIIRGL